MKSATVIKYTNGDRYISGLLPGDVVVAIDNGHGDRYHTAGKRSADGRYFEGEWARLMAKKLKSALEELGFGAWLVAPENTDTPRMERCRRANDYMAKHPDKYHIFISLHTNAAGDASLKDGWCDSASGLVVYTCRNASDASRVLAKNVYEAGAAMGLAGNRSVPSEHFWQNNWDVITFTKMPAILTESAFHTNHKEVDYLLSEKGQEDIINYHVAGICKTFGIPYSIKRA